ncbi:MAG: helix-turn-helix domain-containing protein [Coriobacteriia bacterium]
MEQSSHIEKPVFFPKKDQLTVSIAKAAELLCLSKSYLYRETRAGHIPAKKVGTRTLFIVEDLKLWIANQEYIKKAA